MTFTKEECVDLHEKYEKVVKLLEDSKSDPPNEPYASKYAARDILDNMKSNLENLLNSKSEKTIKLTAMMGVVYLYEAMVCIDTEELSAGESYLQKCFNIVKDHSTDSHVIMVILNMYNQFGILWFQRDPEKSKMFLEKAEKLYTDFKNLNIAPVDISDLFVSNIEEKNVGVAVANMEKIYTFTLYYLAQIYGLLKDTLKSSVYCHITLQRQLDSGDYDSIEWALNAATLSQVFMEKNGFKQARHHLAASSFILDKYQQELESMTDQSEEHDGKIEVFKHRSADVARCWAKYGLWLLAKSKERLLNHTDEDEHCTLSPDLSTLSLDVDATVTVQDLHNLEFSSLNLNSYERQVTDKFVLTIQDARVVFLNIQTWLQKAESYYTLDTLASDHIEIVLDKTQMYLNFLFFEDNVEIQAKLHKRRIDVLENVINKINPQYYLQYCRQIWFELAQTYSDILNIKVDKLRESNDRPTPHGLAKINHLVERSIYNFNCFIDSFKEKVDKKIPSKISDDFEKPFLQAYFNIGALNGKYITLDKKAQLTNTEASYKAYKTVLDYCNSNNKASEAVPMEYGICKELVSLLPVKMTKLRQELS